MTLASWFHNLDQFAIEISAGIGLRWYGLAYVAGFIIAWILLKQMARRRWILIPAERVGDAILLAVAGVVLGGRLGYVLLYEPQLLWSFTNTLPWWDLLAVNKGGMAFHGGLIGVGIASWRISRGWKDEHGNRSGQAPFLHVADSLTLVTPFGLFFGRIANFINGELLGKIVAMPGEPAPWWSVKFPQEMFTGHQPELTNVQEGQWMSLFWRMRIGDEPQDVTYARILREIQGGSAELAAQLEPLISARHPSQLYQAAAEGIIVGAVLWLIWRKPRVPGAMCSWFLILYGVSRIVTELWRLPDAHLEVERVLGLSRGQWLSVAMIVVGLYVLRLLARRGGEAIGGWGGVRKAGGPSGGQTQDAADA